MEIMIIPVSMNVSNWFYHLIRYEMKSFIVIMVEDCTVTITVAFHITWTETFSQSENFQHRCRLWSKSIFNQLKCFCTLEYIRLQEYSLKSSSVVKTELEPCFTSHSKEEGSKLMAVIKILTTPRYSYATVLLL